ncbi:IS4 family transposase [Endozoicomonas sp. SCSIO W0465]|uniref:IS4 family transposase n=1 Tax=Endozoicomonas sp. SCSIO W0465 TaxID=2918516 RepID=UPI00207647C3|nr:IS4 family transposase [Endozoicomonas sp. SCSIO W0465]USE36212.1 IS4 family transposase [Endozoicomonas sp. SCSIO W0465]USE36912.1 IS4 family transposase [Endozoicomonas sp. SCSIO W0465]
MLPLSPKPWSELTFGCADLGDTRRTKRLVKVAAELSAHTGNSLSSSCEGYTALVTGAYRLIENEAVKPEAIAEAGFQATAKIARQSRLLLALEDTTTLGYKHAVRSELGDLGGPEGSKTRGFHVHSVFLVDADTERSIGLIDQERWVREDVQRGKKNQRRQLPYEGKESFKWQRASENTEQRMGGKMPDIISVCDREADIYEYMHYKLDNRQRFVVRATQNRILVDGELLLFDSLAQTEVLGKYTIVVPQKGGRKKRKATLQVKRKKMTIQAPQRPGGRPEPVTMNIVSAEEIGNDSEDRLHWVLLTTEDIETFEYCRSIIRFYELRWRIEEFHKAWKSGAGVERLRLQSPDNIERLAVILMFVAVRLMQIREALMLPNDRQHKDRKLWSEKTLANEVVSDDEWQVLWLTYEKKALPDKPPTVTWLLQTIARLGGWGDSKHTGQPGWLVVWEGWAKLQDRVKTWQIARQFSAGEM